MLTLRQAMARHSFRRARLPGGGEAIDDACSLAEVYAASSITREELAKLREAQEIRERSRRRDMARQMRAETAAAEWAASRGGSQGAAERG